MNDIVDRMRDLGATRAGGGPGDASYDPELLSCMYDAADEIERLRAERDALRERIERAPVFTATRNGVIRTKTCAFEPGACVRLVLEDE